MAIDDRSSSLFPANQLASFCLSPNDSDRNLFGQCNYIANRTLIRCGQFRRKDELARNGGQCDQHLSFRATIKERYVRDTIILKNNCPPKSPRTRRFTRTVKSDTIVVDQDPCLLPKSQWHSEIVPDANRDAVNYIPLLATTVMTEKELNLQRILLLKQEILGLHVQKKQLEGQAERRKRKKKLNPVWIVNQGKKEGQYTKPKNICQHGHPDEEIIKLTVDRLVHIVSGEGSTVMEGMTGCTRPALIGFDFCIRHIKESTRKPLFNKCKDCDNFIFDDMLEGIEGVCPVHKHIKSRKFKTRYSEIDGTEDIDKFSEGECNEIDKGPAAKKPKRPVIRTQVSFTSVPPSSLLQRRPSDKMPIGPQLEAARCRPFRREYFPPKAQGRPTIPYGHARPVGSLSRSQSIPGQEVRMVTLQRIPSQSFQRNTTIQRITTQDRQRNRMQQEEDMKAAASIAGAEGEPQGPSGANRPPYTIKTQQSQQNRILTRGPIAPQYRPSQISSATLAANIASLPEEIKNQPLGSVLRQGLITPLTQGTSGQYNSVRPRLPVQTTIRKPETPVSNSVLTGVVRNIPAPNSSQRHQIASVDVPPVRRQVIPPHRVVRPSGQPPQIPSGSLAPTSQFRPSQPIRQSIQPKMIPLEKIEGITTAKVGLTPTTSASKPAPLPADFMTTLVDEGRVPESPIQSKAPNFSPAPLLEDKPEFLRKKTRPSLPMPKLPNVLSRSKPKIIPSDSQVGTQQISKQNNLQPSTSSAPIVLKEQSSTPAKQSDPSLVSEASKIEGSPGKIATSRQGQRRSSRLEKPAESGERGETTDPLSLLADVSAAVRNPE